MAQTLYRALRAIPGKCQRAKWTDSLNNGLYLKSGQYVKSSSRTLYSLSSRRRYSTAPQPLPTPEGAAKEYSPKIVGIVEEISKMTILEVADLNELLKIRLNIKDVPVMAATAAPVAAAAPVEEVEVMDKPREKTIFTVKLMSFDAGKKVALIKEVKNLMEGMNLVQAKKFVESVPQTLKEDIPKEEAEALKTALEAVGAVV